jgi:hypothetical protein
VPGLFPAFCGDGAGVAAVVTAVVVALGLLLLSLPVVAAVATPPAATAPTVTHPAARSAALDLLMLLSLIQCSSSATL